MDHAIKLKKYSEFIKLYFLGKNVYPFSALLTAVSETALIPYFQGNNLAGKLSYAKLNQAKQSGGEHGSVAVVLQVQEVAGPEAALLHNASLYHHLHLVFEGIFSHLIIAACCSARLRREKS